MPLFTTSFRLTIPFAVILTAFLLPLLGDEPRQGDKNEKSITNSIGMKMALIPAGTFMMGSPKTEETRGDDEDQHEVKITKPFYLGVHEVTVGQFRAFVRAEGYQTEAEKAKEKSTWQKVDWEQTDDHPVVNVSWNDSVAFCDWLSKKEGKKYRLPTEAEWEYACRARTTTPFHFSATISTDQANYNGNEAYGRGKEGIYRKKTMSVGSFPGNAWGLHDMHGNVCEWCNDRYGAYDKKDINDPQGDKNGALRVLRGGSWYTFPYYLRSAFRVRNELAYRLNSVGFRSARTIDN